MKAWGEVVWLGQKLNGLDPEAAVVTEDDENGTLWLPGGMRLEIADPEAPGDGTVLLTSASAPGRANVKASFEHGRGLPQTAPALHNDAKGYDHQGSYNDKTGRSLFATLYGVVRCAQVVSAQ